MTLFEVREGQEGWLANETLHCHKQNNLQKRCCVPLHLSCLRESSAFRAGRLPSPLHRTLQLQLLLCAQKDHPILPVLRVSPLKKRELPIFLSVESWGIINVPVHFWEPTHYHATLLLGPRCCCAVSGLHTSLPSEQQRGRGAVPGSPRVSCTERALGLGEHSNSKSRAHAPGA